MFAVLVLYMNNLQLKVCLIAIAKSKAICASYDITVTSWLKQLSLRQPMCFIAFNGFLLMLSENKIKTNITRSQERGTNFIIDIQPH